MKTKFTNMFKFSLTALVLAGMVVMTACNDDEDPVVDAIVGNYKLTSATYQGLFNPVDQSTTEVPTNVDPVPGEIAVGGDITALAIGILNGVPECTDPTQVQIEFRQDFSLWITCDGVGTEASGTWTRVDEQTVTLNIAPTDAIPTGLSLTLSGAVVAGNNLGATIAGFPMPKDVTVDLGGSLPDGSVNIQLVTAGVNLVKQ